MTLLLHATQSTDALIGLGGPRACIGQQLATFTAILVMAHLARDWDLSFAPGYIENVELVSLPSGERTPRYATAITMPMLAPLEVRVTKRVIV